MPLLAWKHTERRKPKDFYQLYIEAVVLHHIIPQEIALVESLGLGSTAPADSRRFAPSINTSDQFTFFLKSKRGQVLHRHIPQKKLRSDTSQL